MSKRSQPTSTDPAHAPALDGVMTLAEFERQTTLSRTTIWRLCRTDPILSQARVQLTPTRVGLRRSGAAGWLETRTGAR